MASNELIVVFKKSTSKEDIAAAASNIEKQGGIIKYRYYENEKIVLYGFSASVPDSAVVALRNHPGLDFIEADGVVTIQTADLLKKKIKIY